jgi:hypothetical protein
MLRRLATVLAVMAMGLMLAAPAMAQYGEPDETSVGASTGTVAPGGTVTITGEGFAPGTTVTIRLGADVLATGTVRADGTFAIPVTMPTQPGTYTLTVDGIGADGLPVSFNVTITVAAGAAPGQQVTVTPGTGLAATGGPFSVGAILAIALLAIGGFALLGARAKARAAADA